MIQTGFQKPKEFSKNYKTNPLLKIKSLTHLLPCQSTWYKLEALLLPVPLILLLSASSATETVLLW